MGVGYKYNYNYFILYRIIHYIIINNRYKYVRFLQDSGLSKKENYQKGKNSLGYGSAYGDMLYSYINHFEEAKPSATVIALILYVFYVYISICASHVGVNWEDILDMYYHLPVDNVDHIQGL